MYKSICEDCEQWETCSGACDKWRQHFAQEWESIRRAADDIRGHRRSDEREASV